MLAFDTHTYIKELKAAGFTEEQAEVQARTLKNIIDNDLASKQNLKELEIALKHDLKELEVALKHEIELVRWGTKELEAKMEIRFKEQDSKTETQIKGLETKMETRLKELELRRILRLGAMLIIGIGVVATLVKLLWSPVFSPLANSTSYSLSPKQINKLRFCLSDLPLAKVFSSFQKTI